MSEFRVRTSELPCIDCGERHPPQKLQFRLCNGIPQFRCANCEKTRQQQEEVKARKDAAKAVEEEGAAGLFRLLAGGKIKAAHISELNEKVIDLFGGLDGFARFFQSQIVMAAAQNPGGKTVLDACRQVTQIIVASTQHRKSAPDVENLSDDDLERELQRITGLKIHREGEGDASKCA